MVRLCNCNPAASLLTRALVKTPCSLLRRRVHLSALVCCYRSNYYSILELDSDASSEDIKKAFYRLSLACHPDRSAGNSQAVHQFHAISEAYQVLSNPRLRRNYDKDHLGLIRPPGAPDASQAGHVVDGDAFIQGRARFRRQFNSPHQNSSGASSEQQENSVRLWTTSGFHYSRARQRMSRSGSNGPSPSPQPSRMIVGPSLVMGWLLSLVLLMMLYLTCRT